MNADLLKALLAFFSTLLWQGILVAFLFYFRRELHALVERIAKLKLGEAEIAFQPPAESPPPPAPEAQAVARLIEPDGFYTTEGVRHLIETSGLVQEAEKVQTTLQFFGTPRQRTWLAATTNQFFCILDDERTRASCRLIQWLMPFRAADPIHTKPYRDTIGLLDIGERRNWLYSKALHPDPERLEIEIRRMVAQAKQEGV